ncbi:MAG: hypothetical protein KAS12_01890 [Candidatus Aenigmarchaeota archaeon]|nr:hypothetical protein [Candidatus Aenigmarchaeota archaeon]
MNHHTTIEMVDLFKNERWKWKMLSKMISNDDILNYPHLPWDWNMLSKVIPFDSILNHIHLPWNWCYVSSNKSINSEAIELLPNMRWDKRRLALNMAISLEMVFKKKWQIYLLSHRRFYERSDITIEFILKHPNYNWNWVDLTTYSNISFSDIMKNPDLPWAYEKYFNRDKFSDLEHKLLEEKYGRKKKDLYNNVISSLYLFFII